MSHLISFRFYFPWSLNGSLSRLSKLVYKKFQQFAGLVRHPIGVGIVYSILWWCVAWSWRYNDLRVGAISVLAFFILFWLIQGSSSFGYRQLSIGAIGIVTDYIHSFLGLIPTMTIAEGAVISGLWISFGQLMAYGIFGSMSYRWAAIVGGLGALFNYQGLVSWMGHTPTYSLIWLGLEWMVLFPLFLYIVRRSPFNQT
jgi:hypothetical protein